MYALPRLFIILLLAFSTHAYQYKFCKDQSDCATSDQSEIYTACADQIFFNACDYPGAQRANILVEIGSINPFRLSMMAWNAMQYYNQHPHRDADLSKRIDIKRLMDAIGDTNDSYIRFILRMRPLTMGTRPLDYANYFNTTDQFLAWVGRA